MTKLENAVSFAVSVANDNMHGYSQIRRNGGIDYDCSSLVLTALKLSGISTGSASYTGDMLKPLIANGFTNVRATVNLSTGAGLVYGDILLKPKTDTRGGHTAFYIGNGKIVQAQHDFDGVKGDLSGRELSIIDYYNSPWVYVLRYKSDTTPTNGVVMNPEKALFAVKLKEDMNVRTGAGKIFSKVEVAKAGLILGISQVSINGAWGRIQNQPKKWICVASRYVYR